MNKEYLRKVGLSLANAAKKGDAKAVAKWATKALVAVTPPPSVEDDAELNAAVAVAPATPVPNFGESKKMGSALYGDWVTAWFQRTFPEAYRDWPPTVYAVTPQAIVEAATKDGCLAQVSACGSLGFPGGPYDALGDWSLYTALTSTTDGGQFLHQVWHMGKLVGEKVGGPNDGLDFAHSLGFDW